MTRPELFNDLVDEILWRVPATSLKRLRSTCKRWNRLFKDDGRFAREHSEKAAKEFLFLMVTENDRIQQMSVNLHGEVPSVELRRELSLPDPDFNNKRQFDISEAFHCDGLLVCTHGGTRKYGSKIVVWNPFTGQTRWIETGNRCKTANSFFLGYCYQDKKKNKSCSKSYKILCFGMFGEDTEIYELNSDSWRRIPDISPCWSIGYIGYSEHSVSLKGNTYWFGKEKSKEHLGMSLLRFDFTTEKASICVPLPYQCPWYKIMSLSVVRGEKLSVFLQPEKSCKAEIWVTNKIDDTTLVVSWSKVLALYLSPLLQIIPDLYITDNILFWLDEEKKVALCFQRDTDMEDEDRAFDKIFILEEDNKVTEVGYGANTTPPSAGCWPAILSYVPSLVQIEREGGKTLNYIESQLRRPFAQRSMTIPELFKDLVDEILCRVPATSLKRLRPTCKRWNRLFKDDGRFAREHSEKAAKEFLFLMLTENYRIRQVSVNLHGEVPSVELRRELSLPDPHFNNKCQFDISEAFHCDGLLLGKHNGSSWYGSKIVVWNPFTGQSRWIEAGNRCWRRLALGYCYQDKKKKNKSCSKSYKVLYFNDFGEYSEIYELNSDSWRRIPAICPCWSFEADHIVSLKGNTYWFGKEKSKEHLGVSLLRFDFTTEKASICVPLPYQCPLYEVLSLSVVKGEKLSVFLQPDVRCKAEIWVTNKIDDTTNTLVVSWTKVLSLDLSPHLQIFPDLDITDEMLFWLDEEKKAALCCQRYPDMEDEERSFDKIFILEEDNKVTEVGFGANTTPTGACWPAVLSYVPSLVQIEQDGGKRKRGD